MIRRTSAESYARIKAEGLLGRLQWLVYDALYQYGPKTEGEVWMVFEGLYQRHSIAPRMAELKRMGLVYEVGERPCKLTGKMCLTWDVTDGLPIASERKETKDQVIRRLTTEIAQLKRRICDKCGCGKTQGELWQ